VAAIGKTGGMQAGSGFTPGVIEVLNRSGVVLQRVPYKGGEVRVGRAYDNDIIIGDPYICPHHLVIRPEQGQLVFEDLGSINGTWDQKGRVSLHKAQVQAGQRVQLGHSQLRFQPTDSELPPAWRDTARHGLLSIVGQRWMWPLAAVLCGLALALDKVLDSSKALVPGVLASQLVYPLLGVMLWAGFWSLLNQIIAHRPNFRIHLSIAALAVTALFINSEAIPLAGFALGWSQAVGWIKTLGQITILGFALITHMKYATHGRSWTQAVGAGVLATMLIGIPQYEKLSQIDDFSNLPRLEPLLKPPAAKLVKGISVEEFVQRAQSLRQELDKDAPD